MKKIVQNILLVTALFTAAASCKKTVEPVINNPGNPSVEKPFPIQLNKDGNAVNVNYNTDGTIQSLITSDANGNILVNYIFSYENGKLKEVNFGGKWKYTYTGNQLTRIESFNQQGQNRYTYDVVYNGDKVLQKTEYYSATMTPRFKTTYTYRADGNIEKYEVQQYINSAWEISEEVVFNEYDQHVNVSDAFENHPYLPSTMLSANNPVKETWSASGVLEQTVEHVYTYDQKGRPKTKKSTFKSPGFPDTFSEIKILY